MLITGYCKYNIECLCIIFIFNKQVFIFSRRCLSNLVVYACVEIKIMWERDRTQLPFVSCKAVFFNDIR